MLSSIFPKLKIVEEQGARGVYTIEPLERTFGITLGNALRRVLLSALPGLAVTCVKIVGASHEFSTLEGMKEDVLDFLLNVKQLRLQKKGDIEKSVSLQLEAKGTGKIYARDIKCPSEVKIVNPDLYLTTLTNKKGKLQVEFVVEEGRGYVPASERHYSKKKAVDLIPVDSLFTPVRKVNYEVEPTRVGQSTDYDKLSMEIETDDTITPMDAMNLSAGILVEHFNILIDPDNYQPDTEYNPVEAHQEEMQKAQEEAPSVASDLTIEDLGLSTRVLNSLHGANINTVSELIECTEGDLMKLRNFGQKSLNEIVEQLKERQLTLKQVEEL